MHIARCPNHPVGLGAGRNHQHGQPTAPDRHIIQVLSVPEYQRWAFLLHDIWAQLGARVSAKFFWSRAEIKDILNVEQPLVGLHIGVSQRLRFAAVPGEIENLQMVEMYQSSNGIPHQMHAWMIRRNI
jgi:hypothetical protein